MPKPFDVSPYLNECIERLNDGHSIRMIASWIGVDHCTLAKRLREKGVQVPERKDALKRMWKNHKHPHLGKKGRDSYAYGKTKSIETLEKLSASLRKYADEHRKGIKNHSGGYVLVYSPGHPAADNTGYVLEHRLRIEEKIGRCLDSNEIVHHINGNKRDNRIDNLVIVSRSEHVKIHKNGGIR